ncbi:MAG: hypothetical protein AB7L92_08745, partial [Alphaproteobacteria bacterium]
NSMITIRFSKEELGMLAAATGGPVFQNTQFRSIPVLADWKEIDALKFEANIRKHYDESQLDKSELSLSVKELRYLSTIHDQSMKELEFQEYQTITGYTWEEAQQLRNELRNAI